MAMKPNYNFEKRQRELAKKKQQDEKRQKKLARNGDKTGGEGERGDAAPDAKPQS
jgi:hypothetical protein